MASISSTSSPTIRSFNSSINPRPPSCMHRRPVLRSLAIALLMLLLVFAVSVSIAWLLLHPHLPAVKAESLSASGFNISNSRLSATHDVQITITNPNRKINLLIDHFSLRMAYKNVIVSKVDSEPYGGVLILPNTQSQVKFQMNMAELNDKKRRKIARDMRMDRSRGVISFDMMINVSVKFRSGFLPSKQTLLKVSCQNLNILFPSTEDFGHLQVGKYCLVGH